MRDVPTDPSPDVSLCMHCVDAIETVRESVEAALRQEGPRLELIVVDDGSRDRSLEILRSFEDSRLRLVSWSERRGPGASFNRALQFARAPVVVLLDAQEVLLPGAVSRLFETLRDDPSLGQVGCLHYSREDDGPPSYRTLTRLQRQLPAGFDSRADYTDTFLRNRRFLRGVRALRREVFETIGEFCEDRHLDADYDVALRMVARYRIGLCREFLYFVRVPPRRRPPWEGYYDRVAWRYRNRRTFQALLERDPPEYLAGRKADADRELFGELRKALVPFFVTLVFGKLRRLWRIRGGLRLRMLWARALEKIGALCPLPRFARADYPLDPGERRILYFIWEFPVLSQTFVQREVLALVEAGVAVRVATEHQPADGFMKGYEEPLTSRVNCLPPLGSQSLAQAREYFRGRYPLRLFWISLYVHGRRYLLEKSSALDQRTMDRALLLADVARRLGVDHIHSPWADQCAFVALLAARLLGVSYSVQARAHDLHRHTYRYGLQEKFQHARFVVTNTRYNVAKIRERMGRRPVNLHLIYNGIDLRRFPAPRDRPPHVGPVRLLSVARLIAQKGLKDLLEMCVRLRARGISFTCDVIGAPENGFMTDFVELKRLHRSHRLDEIVRFRGPQPFQAVLEAYQAADLFVLPCVIAPDGSRDITPNSLIEAMAMQLPVVSTTATGVPEIVEHRVSGILVPPADVEALTDALVELIEDRALRERLARNARRKVESQFQAPENVRGYERLFRNLDAV